MKKLLTKKSNKETVGKKVFIGVSGGVDSSVSLYLLQKAGYDVTGVFIRTWHPDFISCSWKDDRRDAMRVCARLGVPFLEFDAEEAYKQKVGEVMIEGYKLGLTPNPDVLCNEEVKFGVFYDFAKSNGAMVATGHYADIKNEKLIRGLDKAKDQSYFLWKISQDKLKDIIFPIGGIKKTKVRKIAEKIGLHTAKKKDSQGVCFLGEIDMKDFLSRFVEASSGDVLDTEGNKIGSHDGAIFYTMGERHGFTLDKPSPNSSPLYVVDKNIEKNTITVSPYPKVKWGSGTIFEDLSSYGLEKMDERKLVLVKACNELSGGFSVGEKYDVEFRYHGKIYKAKCLSKKESDKSSIFMLDVERPLLSSGQSMVVYEKNVCKGGGIISV